MSATNATPLRNLICEESSTSDEASDPEIESFILDKDIVDVEETWGSVQDDSILLPDFTQMDAETQDRLQALLQAAGISRVSTNDVNKALSDPEILRRLTSCVAYPVDDPASFPRHRSEDTRSSSEPGEDSCINDSVEEGESLLSLACSAGYYELAQVLLAMHTNVEDRGAKGDCTPLMEAASAGHLEILKLLLHHGAHVNAQSSTGNTPLMYACAGGHEDVVIALLEAGASVNIHNENGHTPLMEAASVGYVNIAKVLIERGANINTHSNEFKESPLTLACYKGHLEMVKYLLNVSSEKGDEHRPDEMHTALMEASMDGHVDVARLLLDSGAQVNMPADSFESPLTLAACGGHTELAKLLLDRGALIEEVNDEGYTPLMEAAREGHEEMIALLLSYNADVNCQTEETGETALTLASCSGFLEVAALLVRAGAKVELGANTPLMEASQEGHMDVVNFLIKEGANVEAKTSTNDTALIYAAENGHTDVAMALVEAGANIEHEADGGKTPLMKAARAGHTCTVQYLLMKGANVNKVTTNNENTALSLACSGGYLSTVEVLLQAGANPNHKLKDSSTMLIEAAKGGHTPVIQLLLDWPGTKLTAAEQLALNAEALRLSEVTLPRYTSEGSSAGVTLDHIPLLYQATTTTTAPIGGLGVPPAPGSVGIPQSPFAPMALQNAPAALMGGGDASCKVSAEAAEALAALERGDATIPDEIEALKRLSECEAESVCPGVVSYAELMQSMLHESLVKSSSDKLSQQEREQLQSVLRSQVQRASGSHANGQQTGQVQNPSALIGSTKLTLQRQQEELNAAVRELSRLRKTQEIYEQLQKASKELLEREKAAGGTKDDQEWFVQAQQHIQEQQAQLELQAQQQQQLFQNVAVDQQLTLYLQPNASNTLTDGSGAPASIAEVPGGLPSVSLTASGALEKAQSAPSVLSNPSQHLLQQGDLPCSKFPQLPELTPAQLENLRNSLGAAGVFSPEVVSGTLNEICRRDGDQSGGGPSVEQESQTTQEEIPDSPESPAPSPRASPDGESGSVGTNTGYTQNKDASGGVNVLPSTLSAQGLLPDLIDWSNPNMAALLPALNLAGYNPGTLAENSGPLPWQDPALIPGSAGGCLPSLAVPPYSNLAVSEAMALQEKLSLGSGGVLTPGLSTTTAPGTHPYALPSSQGPPAAIPSAIPRALSAVDLNTQTESNHDTALTLACAGGHEELVALLLERKADIEHRDKKGFTPLMLAATAGHSKVVDALLEKDAFLEAQSERTKDTALSLACSGGRRKVVETLLKAGANKEHRNASDYTPLSLAASGGYVEIINLLLNYGAEINSRTGSKLGISPLMLAAMNGHTAAVKLLLERGSDINAQIETNRNTALTLACFQGRHEVVRLLLEYKANVEHRAKTGLTPLMEAASGGYVEVGRVLIQYGADVNAAPVPSSKDTALTVAADKGHVKFVDLLLQNGASVEVKNKKGSTPLWLAANSGRLDVIQVLTKYGANLDAQDNRKMTPLVAAFRKGHTKVVKWMVKHVNQFPSDQDCMRYISTLTEREILLKCQECMRIIMGAKDKQAAEANKNARILLQEIEKEQAMAEKKQQTKQRQKEKKRQKKQAKKAAAQKTTPDETQDDDEDRTDEQDNEKENEMWKDKNDKTATTNHVPSRDRSSSSSKSASPERKVKLLPGLEGVTAPGEQGVVPDRVPPMPNVSPTGPPEAVAPKSIPPQPHRSSKSSGSTGRATKVFSRSSASTVVSRELLHKNNVIKKGLVENDDWCDAPSNKKTSWLQQKQARVNAPLVMKARENEIRDRKSSQSKMLISCVHIARVIGRGGNNINAIRESTGCFIEVEKQQKGQTDRMVTLRSSSDIVEQATLMINGLINDPDAPVQEIVAKVKCRDRDALENYSKVRPPGRGSNRGSTPVSSLYQNGPQQQQQQQLQQQHQQMQVPQHSSSGFPEIDVWLPTSGTGGGGGRGSRPVHAFPMVPTSKIPSLLSTEAKPPAEFCTNGEASGHYFGSTSHQGNAVTTGTTGSTTTTFTSEPIPTTLTQASTSKPPASSSSTGSVPTAEYSPFATPNVWNQKGSDVGSRARMNFAHVAAMKVTSVATAVASSGHSTVVTSCIRDNLNAAVSRGQHGGDVDEGYRAPGYKWNTTRPRTTDAQIEPIQSLLQSPIVSAGSSSGKAQASTLSPDFPALPHFSPTIAPPRPSPHGSTGAGSNSEVLKSSPSSLPPTESNLSTAAAALLSAGKTPSDLSISPASRGEGVSPRRDEGSSGAQLGTAVRVLGQMDSEENSLESNSGIPAVTGANQYNHLGDVKPRLAMPGNDLRNLQDFTSSLMSTRLPTESFAHNPLTSLDSSWTTACNFDQMKLTNISEDLAQLLNKNSSGALQEDLRNFQGLGNLSSLLSEQSHLSDATYQSFMGLGSQRHLPSAYSQFNGPTMPPAPPAAAAPVTRSSYPPRQPMGVFDVPPPSLQNMQLLDSSNVQMCQQLSEEKGPVGMLPNSRFPVQANMGIYGSHHFDLSSMMGGTGPLGSSAPAPPMQLPGGYMHGAASSSGMNVGDGSAWLEQSAAALGLGPLPPPPQGMMPPGIPNTHVPPPQPAGPHGTTTTHSHYMNGNVPVDTSQTWQGWSNMAM